MQTFFERNCALDELFGLPCSELYSSIKNSQAKLKFLTQRSTENDLTSAIESYIYRYHFQSIVVLYIIAYRAVIVRGSIFAKNLASIPASADKVSLNTEHVNMGPNIPKKYIFGMKMSHLLFM
jgi:hypothetical protein